MFVSTLKCFAGPDLANIAYEQVAHRSRLHPSICKRVVLEALSLLSQHIASSTILQVRHFQQIAVLMQLQMHAASSTWLP